MSHCTQRRQRWPRSDSGRGLAAHGPSLMRVATTVLPRAALIEMVLGAAAISTTSVFVKLAHVGPTVSAFYRMAFGGRCCCWARSRCGQWRGPLLMSRWLVIPAFAFAVDLMLWHRSILYVGRAWRRCSAISRCS